LGRFGVTAASYDRPDRHSQEIKAASTPLAYLLIALVGRGARNKRVPAQILNGPPEARRASATPPRGGGPPTPPPGPPGGVCARSARCRPGEKQTLGGGPGLPPG